jgi:hypothetical protein
LHSDICRRTTLYPSIAAEPYPLAPDELLLTPNVKIIKDSKYLPLFPAADGGGGMQHLVNIDGVLTSAAPCMPEVSRSGRRPTAYRRDSDRALMRQKVRRQSESGARVTLCLQLQ